MLNAAPQRTRHLAPGDKLGKYEVIRQIAIGGMAELYLARTLGIEGFEKLVVIKRILPQYVSNSSFVTMFLNEARLAATLHHPNVAQVYDIGLEDGDYFFAMEYVHGEDLDRIGLAGEEQGVPMVMDAALTLVAGLCAGLHYAHEKANTDGRPLMIVHRDVSPSNVLVSYDGAVKLVDFGIARATSRPGTTQGGLKGKIAYMSPEQCRQKATLDRRSDLYSVGTILYELTTGQLPFSGETEYQILNQIVNEDVPPPSKLIPEYPQQLEKILLRALARDPDQRYATALQLQTDVEDFAHESRLRISPLVLARLMGQLFPTRLEEWDHAKAQGAKFLQQHVVRTLIESGKTPDRDTQETKALIEAAQARQDAAAAAAEQALRQYGDDDPTNISQSFTDLTDTTIGAPPIATSGETAPFAQAIAVSGETETSPFAEKYQTDVGQPPEVDLDQGNVRIDAPPEPKPEQAYPMVTELMRGAPGSLVTSQGKYGGVPLPLQPEPTEPVREAKPRASSPTTFVRTRDRTKTTIAIVGLVTAAGVLATVIAMRGGDAPAPASSEVRKLESAPADPTPVGPPVEATKVEPPAQQPEPKPVTKPEPNPVAKPEPKPLAKPEQKPAPVAAKPEPVAAKPAPVAAKREPAVAKPAPVAAKPEPKKPVKAAPVAKPAPPVAKPKAVAKPRVEAKKPDPKPEPKKEPGWNDDSPFMPVRTEKK